MLDFKRITYLNLEDLAPFYRVNPYRISDFSPYEKAMWSGFFSSSYCLKDGELFIKEAYDKGKWCYFLPFGPHLEQGLKVLEQEVLQQGQLLELAVVPDELKEKLISRYPHAEVFADRDWSDYLYNASDLAQFSGKKYAAQRNHVSRFMRDNPDWAFKIATRDDIPALKKFYFEYEQGLAGEHNPEKVYEAFASYLLIDHIGEKGLLAAYLTAQGKICAFEIGEIGGDVLFEHVEKANREVEGSYAMMVKQFALAYQGQVSYINREEDTGDEGLRTSKLRYNPVSLLSKNFFRFHSNVDLIERLPLLETERLSLGPIDEGDKEAYSRLCLDDELNRYWGYDYKEDLKGQKPDPDYFLRIVQDDFAKRDSFCFMIKPKGEKRLLGECVLHSFTSQGQGEIGLRLFKEEQKKGYALEAIKRVVDYAYSQLRLSEVLVSAYPANQASIKLIGKLPVKPVEDQDGKKRFLIENN